MTALAAAGSRDGKRNGGVYGYKMAASTQIWKDGLVMINSAGLAVPAASAAGNKGCVGVAIESVLSTASGGEYIEVQAGTFEFAGATLEQEDVGGLVYAADDNTIDETDSGSLPIAGKLVEYLSASLGMVEVGPQYAERANQEVWTPLTFPVTMASIADGDVVTTFTPGFAGTIQKVGWVQDVAVTTASKASTLNLEIGTTNVTGGTVALTSAACTPQGAIIEGAAITAANTFSATDTISVEASSTTTFIEGTGSVVIWVSQTVTK